MSRVWVLGLIGLWGCSQVGTSDVNGAIRSCIVDDKWDDSAQAGDCGLIREALVASLVAPESAAQFADNVDYDQLADKVVDGVDSTGAEDGFYATVALGVEPSTLAEAIVAETTFVSDAAPVIATSLVNSGGEDFYGGLAGALVDDSNGSALAAALVATSSFYEDLGASVVSESGFYAGLADALVAVSGFADSVAGGLDYGAFVDALPADFDAEIASALSGDSGFTDTIATTLDWEALASAILEVDDLSPLTGGVADGLAADHVPELMSDADLQDALELDLAADTGFVADVAEAAEPALSADGSALRTGLLADLDTDALFQSSVASLVLAALDGAAVVGKVDEYIASSGAFPWAAEVIAVVDLADFQTGADVAATLAGFTFPAAWKTQVDAEVGSVMGDLVDLVAAGAVEFDSGEDLLTFDAVNVRIVNGAGSTDVSNGLGNLVIGYNEDTLSNTRTGSHNVVLGSENRYSGAGGIVLGYSNDLASPFGGFVSGNWNTVSGEAAAAVGGQRNDVTGSYAVAVAGADNETFGSESATMAGNDLHASGSASVLIGGASNVTYGAYSTITGGSTNETYNWATVVTGGYGNEAGNSSDTTGDWNYSVVVGGAGNIAAGYEGVVVSGYGSSLGSSTRRSVLCGGSGASTNTAMDGLVYGC